MRLQRAAAEKRLLPLQEEETPPATLADVTTDYVKLSLNGRVKNWVAVQRMLERPILTDLRAKPVASITRRDVVGVLDTLRLSGTRTEAENMLKQLKALFNWALSRDAVTTNPCNGIRLPRRTVERDRVLSDAEISAVWQAATQLPQPWPGLIRILILTGQRRCEVSGMSWAEIDDRTWLIARERVKKDRPHAVPLTAMALEVLNDRAVEGRSGFVFSSDGGITSSSNFSKTKAKLDALSGVTGWVLHDLRRTVRSKMAELGVPREVARKVLNHEDSVVDRIYNRHEYLAEKREALERWETRLLEIMAERLRP
jgi:integrase